MTFIKFIKNKLWDFSWGFLILACLAIIAVNSFNNALEAKNEDLRGVDVQSEELSLGGVESARWVVFDRFTGFKTKADASKIDDGANPNGQNTIINDGDRISIRDFGYELFGQASTTENRIESLHTFRRRDGENIMMRSTGSYLEYYEDGSDEWEPLVTTSTSAIYDFADYNINTDLRSYTYFGNGSDNFSRWSGAHVLIGTSGVTSTATFIMTGDPTGLGFPASGEIVYCGQRVAYTSYSTTGFEVASAHTCAGDKGLAEAPEEFSSSPKGNIYLVANNRLFISGIASTTQAIYFSEYGDATNFVGADLVTESTASSPGIFNLGEGGGAVTGMALDEGAIYAFKRSLIYKITLDGDGLYTLVPLKPFDGKSQTTGATTNKSIFTGGNGLFFITPDNQIMNLSRIAQVDYPQIVPISDVIKPTIESAVFASSTGIFFQGNGYISAKSDSTINSNDTIFVWNDRINAWESPTVGFNPSSFTIYDDGTGEALYYGDSRVAQTYKIIDEPIDNELGVTANWRSKQFNFNEPQSLKELDNFYVEGYIADNTNLSISLLFDENGYSQIYTTDFLGTEEDYIFSTGEFNLFGYYPFGFQRFGTNDTAELKKFRIYLNKNLRRVPFYNLQMEVASDGINQKWEITSYGFRIKRSTQPEDVNLYRAF